MHYRNYLHLCVLVGWFILEKFWWLRWLFREIFDSQHTRNLHHHLLQQLLAIIYLLLSLPSKLLFRGELIFDSWPNKRARVRH